MQKDFHYDATYVLARCAGLSTSVSEVIATCSQYVDEAVERELPVTPDGFGVRPEVTAHRIGDLKENTDSEDQRQVWVPFHFLPGGEGESQSERLVCKPDSPIARACVDHAVENCKRPYGVELTGVVAHAYADTFAHQGFSGVSSRRNRVKQGSVRLANDRPEASTFFGPLLTALLQRLDPGQGHLIQNFRSAVTGLANLGSLGHASVSICPDQPFLVWSYEYESFDGIPGGGADRINPLDYIDAAQKLHAFFRRIRDARPDLADGQGVPFLSIKGAIQSVLNFVGDSAARSERWRKYANDGAFGAIGAIPTYTAAPMEASRAALTSRHTGDEPKREAAYRFYQAATLHRWFVLRDLLPDRGIVLI